MRKFNQTNRVAQKVIGHCIVSTKKMMETNFMGLLFTSKWRNVEGIDMSTILSLAKINLCI
jgi:hypothetical protein